MIAAFLLMLGATDASQGEERQNMAGMFISDLTSALQRIGVRGARVSYRSDTCTASIGIPVPRRSLTVSPNSGKKIGHMGIGYLFRQSDGASATSNKRGLARIVVDDVDTDVLETSIKTLKLNDLERYNPLLAIVALENTPEMLSGLPPRRPEDPISIVSTLVRHPASGGPHLPKTINDMTANEILDQIALQFGVAVIFSSCNGRDSFRLDVAPIH